MSAHTSRRAARPAGLVVLGAGLVLLVGLCAALNRTGSRPAPTAEPLGPARSGHRASVWSRIVHLAIGVVVLAACAVFAFVGLGPLTGRYRVVTVLSGSMVPTMPVGSLVVSVPEPVSALRVGQIITFQAPTAGHPVVTHRVVEIITGPDGPRIRTKGDANTARDGWLAQVHGSTVWREAAAIPNGGRLVSWFRQRAVHRITVDAIPFLLAVGALSAIWGSSRPTRRPSLA